MRYAGRTTRGPLTKTESCRLTYRCSSSCWAADGLQGPSKGLDALIAFIEGRLLPQDQVAVIAYNRATDFTTDRQPILEVLTRFDAAA